MVVDYGEDKGEEEQHDDHPSAEDADNLDEQGHIIYTPRAPTQPRDPNSSTSWKDSLVVDKELLLSPLTLNDDKGEEGYKSTTCKVTFGDAPPGPKPKKGKVGQNVPKPSLKTVTKDDITRDSPDEDSWASAVFMTDNQDLDIKPSANKEKGKLPQRKSAQFS